MLKTHFSLPALITLALSLTSLFGSHAAHATHINPASLQRVCELFLTTRTAPLSPVPVPGAEAITVTENLALSPHLTHFSYLGITRAIQSQSRKDGSARPGFPEELPLLHEWTTFGRLATILPKTAESALVLTSHKGLSTPAYDGVIFKNNEPYVNVSLKSVWRKRRLKQIIRSAIEKGVAYQNFYSWIKYALDTKQNEPWLAQLPLILGIRQNAPPRKFRVYIDLQKRPPLPNPDSLMIQSVRERIRAYEKQVESVVLMKGAETLKITARGTEYRIHSELMTAKLKGRNRKTQKKPSRRRRRRQR